MREREPVRRPVLRAGTRTVEHGSGLAGTRRVGDEQGRFHIRWQDPGIEIEVETVSGMKITKRTESRLFELKADVTNGDIFVQASPMVPFDLFVQNPDGSPASDASVLAWCCPEKRRDYRVERTTDKRGRAQVGGFAVGWEPKVHIVSNDGLFAADDGFAPLPRNKRKAFTVRLQPAHTGEVELLGPDGEQLVGKVYVWLWSDHWSLRQRLMTLEKADDDPDKVYRVTGLLPGVPYRVSASPRDYGDYDCTNSDAERTWLFSERQQVPKMVLRFKRRERRRK